MSQTPLSDVIRELAAGSAPDAYDRFVAIFRASTVGVMMDGAPAPDGRGGFVVRGGGVTVRSTGHGGGTRILAYADPEVFLQNYGPKFNAGLSGEVLLQMAAGAADSDGILVNCATSEISAVINRATARSLTAAVEEPARRRWWQRR
ncbi:hypothetical protein CS0771_65500 [Catellatospora sp. IY07-71]|uniref:hypothetical protein n=1 Tax=Catellatospora sp. IY07-71 TaxID=2728827 RepID=UPI001BB3208D|nr:hypothetical protein [Catellatospora sp. IY07-71]BCJ77006.1 hypothetical protein CS0771_65500 [Catellatospora sp. IY07-71]